MFSGLVAVALPALALGSFAGSFLFGFIKDGAYKRVMLVLLAFLGDFMIYRA